MNTMNFPEWFDKLKELYVNNTPAEPEYVDAWNELDFFDYWADGLSVDETFYV